VRDAIGQDRPGAAQLGDDPLHVQSDRVFDRIARQFPRLLDRRQNRRDEREGVANRLAAFDRRRDRPTALMAHDDQQRRVEVGDGILEAANLDVSGDVAGRSHGEQVPQPLIEDDLGRHTRIGAAEDRGVRMLAEYQFTLPVGRLMGVDVVMGGVVLVADLQLRQHRFRRR